MAATRKAKIRALARLLVRCVPEESLDYMQLLITDEALSDALLAESEKVHRSGRQIDSVLASVAAYRNQLLSQLRQR